MLMKLKNLWIMCGPSGAGKSTWIKNHMPGARVISRDQIRFSLLKDDEDYFAHEQEVLRIFYRRIQCAIEYDAINNIVVDATHLTPKARKTLLSNLKYLHMVNVNAISIEADLETCLKQNAQRTGRAQVPETVIKNMHASYIIPTKEEGFNEIRSYYNGTNLDEQ